MTDDQRIDYIARNVEALGEWLNKIASNLDLIRFMTWENKDMLEKIDRRYRKSLERKRTNKPKTKRRSPKR